MVSGVLLLIFGENSGGLVNVQYLWCHKELGSES